MYSFLRSSNMPISISALQVIVTRPYDQFRLLPRKPRYLIIFFWKLLKYKLFVFAALHLESLSTTSSWYNLGDVCYISYRRKGLPLSYKRSRPTIILGWKLPACLGSCDLMILTLEVHMGLDYFREAFHEKQFQKIRFLIINSYQLYLSDYSQLFQRSP